MKMIASTLCLLLAGVAAQNYQQVWADEFNGNTLDLTKWGYEVNCDGGGNAELECYTTSPNNLVVQNGSLVITARVQNLNGKKYTSARINTKASAAWKYGRFDFRAKLPNGIYLWPALWMMPRDSVYGGWAASGEIDIMENRGTTNQQESTLHYGGAWPNNVYKGSGPTNMPFDMMADYHLYSAIWTPNNISFLVDGNVYYSQTLQRNFWGGVGTNPYNANGQPFDQYFYIVINLAIGGGFFAENSQSLTTAQAQAWKDPSFYIDYVRVSQLGNSPVVNPHPTPQSSSVRSTTSSSAVPSTQAKPSSTVAQATTTVNACPNGCGSGSCCADARAGGVCYSSANHACVQDFNGKMYLCGLGNGVCNGACYDSSSYKCTSGSLHHL